MESVAPWDRTFRVVLEWGDCSSLFFLGASLTLLTYSGGCRGIHETFHLSTFYHKLPRNFAQNSFL